MRCPKKPKADGSAAISFSGLQLILAHGHGFTLEDERVHSHIVVLSHAYWARRFGKDPSVVGQTLFIKGNPFTIVGIGPEGFLGVEPGYSTDFWIPLQNQPNLNPWGEAAEFGTLYSTPTWWCLQLIARLAPGVSASQALAEVTPRYQRMRLPDWACEPNTPRGHTGTSGSTGPPGTRHRGYIQEWRDHADGAGRCSYS